MSDQVIVRTFSYRHEAEFYRSVLEGSGVASIITADDGGAVHPALALAGGVRLIVAAEDAGRAAEILDAAPDIPPAGDDPI